MPPDGSRARRTPAEVRRHLLSRPSLDELARTYPDEWSALQRELTALGASEDPEALARYVAQLSGPTNTRPGSRQPGRRASEAAALSLQIRRHMAATAMQQARLTATSGVTRGRVRFNLLNGWIAQRLLFERDLVRKPVSLRAFRVLWPLLWQRRRLMPLVEPKGIYCFYSAPLIRELAALVGQRRCLEIAAGDGTLTRFLIDAGVEVQATDDGSWRQSIDYPQRVRQMDARVALRTLRAPVVLCSFPPPGNGFERAVLRSREVETYIVLTTRDRHAAGNWDAYADSETLGFAMREDERLSRMLLPPEIDPAVLVFERVTA